MLLYALVGTAASKKQRDNWEKGSKNSRRYNIFCKSIKRRTSDKKIPGRYHKAFPKMDSTLKVNVEKLYQKIHKLSAKLDKARRVSV